MDEADILESKHVNDNVALDSNKDGKSSSIQNIKGEIPLTFPDKLASSKVLFELPFSKEAFETDLSGDTGSVGRFIVTKGKNESKLQLDFKGVVYNGEPMVLAGSCMVVSLAPTGAKVETIFNDYVRLTKDPSNAEGASDAMDFFDQYDDEDDGFANPSNRQLGKGKANEKCPEDDASPSDAKVLEQKNKRKKPSSSSGASVGRKATAVDGGNSGKKKQRSTVKSPAPSKPRG